jgi:hypothetical protein
VLHQLLGNSQPGTPCGLFYYVTCPRVKSRTAPSHPEAAEQIGSVDALSLTRSIEMIPYSPTHRPAPWANHYANRGPHSHLYAGSPDRPRRVSLLDLDVTVFACPRCLQRFYGSDVISSSCPACSGQLQIIGCWDLGTVAWLWLSQLGGGL